MQRVRLLVVHFLENFLGKDFFNVPELFFINKFLGASRRGIRITGETVLFIKELMIKMHRERGFTRLINLLSILDRLSYSNDCHILASEGYKSSINLPDTDRINKIYEYIVDYFNENICLDDVSSQPW